mmetsp:Transcript_87015/g.173785  ORF Transcript_87015/g.173785 Transcript_87015/m.173785 type:complete len:228 (-) Transcript_87015:210-893(-)
MPRAKSAPPAVTSTPTSPVLPGTLTSCRLKSCLEPLSIAFLSAWSTIFATGLVYVCSLKLLAAVLDPASGIVAVLTIRADAISLPAKSITITPAASSCSPSACTTRTAMTAVPPPRSVCVATCRLIAALAAGDSSLGVAITISPPGMSMTSVGGGGANRPACSRQLQVRDGWAALQGGNVPARALARPSMARARSFAVGGRGGGTHPRYMAPFAAHPMLRPGVGALR